MRLELFWIVHASLMLGGVGVILPYLLRHQRTRHIALMATSYLILTGIDVYTVCFEGYPVRSLKSCLMIVAFCLGQAGLWMLIARVSSRHVD